MIVLAGLTRDRTLMHTAAVAVRSCIPFQFLDLAKFCEDGNWEWDFDRGSGVIATGDEKFDFRSGKITGVYNRLVDISSSQGTNKARWSARTCALRDMMQNARCRVVNRPLADLSNSSKVFQLTLLRRCGFDVPRSVLANDFSLVASRVSPGRTVYKGASSQGTIAALLGPDDFSRMRFLKNSPVLFQEYLEGMDVRLHMVGERVFGELIEKKSGNVDYRYSTGCRFESFSPPDDIVRKCRKYLSVSGLSFVGFDFIIDQYGKMVVLEANPMPGYDGYDRRADCRITMQLLEELSRPTRLIGSRLRGY